MFANYVRNAVRTTPLNIAVARIVVAGWIIWKTIWYDWYSVVTFPPVGRAYYEVFAFTFPPIVLVIEKYLLIIAMLALIVGYRMGLATAVGAVTLGHLGLARFALQDIGETTGIFLGVYMLIFLGMYRQYDVLSADGIRRTGSWSFDELHAHLDGVVDRSTRHDALRWGLLVMAIVYFGSAWWKVFTNPDFATAENLTRIITLEQYTYRPWSWNIAPIVVEFPFLIWALAVGTLVLEFGLLVAVLMGLPLWLVILPIFMMHATIGAIMGIVFWDVYPLFMMYFAYDSVHKRLARDTSLDVVYDGLCHFCARSLYPFSLVNDGTVRFIRADEAPAAYRDLDDVDDVDFERSMYAFRDGVAYEGYYAFRELFRQFRLLAPIAWVMSVPPVEWMGLKVYRYVAANRSRHFVCHIDFDESVDVPSDTDATDATNTD